MPITHDADNKVDPRRQIGRRPVRDRQRPQRGCRWRKHQPDRDLGHFHQKESVEIEGLTDADLAKFAQGQNGKRIACRPGDEHDHRIRNGGGEKEQNGSRQPTVTGRPAHAGIERLAKATQHQKGRDRSRDHQRKLGQGVDQDGGLTSTQPIEHGRSAGDLTGKASRPIGKILGGGLRDQSNPAAKGQILGRRIGGNHTLGLVGQSGRAQPLDKLGAGGVIFDHVDKQFDAGARKRGIGCTLPRLLRRGRSDGQEQGNKKLRKKS